MEEAEDENNPQASTDEETDGSDPANLLAHYFVVCGIDKNRPLYPYEQTEQLHATQSRSTSNDPSLTSLLHEAQMIFV